MSNETLKELLSLLQGMSGACADLEQRIAAAEEVFQEHSPELHQEYLAKVHARRSGGLQITIALTFEQLHKKLLQG